MSIRLCKHTAQSVISCVGEVGAVGVGGQERANSMPNAVHGGGANEINGRGYGLCGCDIRRGSCRIIRRVVVAERCFSHIGIVDFAEAIKAVRKTAPGWRSVVQVRRRSPVLVRR